MKRHDDGSEELPLERELAEQAFSRASGAPLIEGNAIRLLKDAQENYPAWLAAIRSARRYVQFENYIVHDDEIGREFAEALCERARAGVAVRVLYDWLGCFSTAPRAYWQSLRDAGVEVRRYNPPSWDSPFGWVSRDHRKTLSVDGELGFISGLCVGQMWIGDPERGLLPWRDSGVEVRGPAVAQLELAFAGLWARLGDPLPHGALTAASAPVGAVALRIVATLPATAGILRVNEMVAALARERLWLTDAYFAGTTGYVRALQAAARAGVDVRLLLPGTSDIPMMKPLSRVGYRTLMQAGVRIFEWRGTMLHAKTSVADSRWARVGSTNLNVASWFGNCELDVLVDDQQFAIGMEEAYLRDLENATEMVLDERSRLRAPATAPRAAPGRKRRGAGSGARVGRAVAGAARLGSTVGAAMADRRVLEPVEAHLMLGTGAASLAIAVVIAVFPKALAWPVAALLVWTALALSHRGYKLLRRADKPHQTAERDKLSTKPSP
jgi:cardiolipin synthase A/B